MSSVSSLRVVGHVLEARLDASLALPSLSPAPLLSGFNLQRLTNRADDFASSPALDSPGLEDLDRLYDTALELLSAGSAPSDVKEDAWVLELRFRGSRSSLFDADGSWLGDLRLIGSDQTDLSDLMVAALAEPQSFQDPSLEEEVLILLLSQPISDGSRLSLDFEGDGEFDEWIEPLRLSEAFQPLEARRVVLDPAVLNDCVVEVRDPDATGAELWSDWTSVELSQATAGPSSVEWRLDSSDNHGLSVIPADWLVRLSYDDLLSETIRSADLRSEAGVLLQLDIVLIRQLQDALLRGDLQAATLTLGPADRADQIYSFDLDDYSSSDALVTAVGSADWVGGLVDRELGVLALQDGEARQGLENFQVELHLLHPGSTRAEPVYNVARLMKEVDGIWESLDADGRSLWNDWSGGALELDRFGDQRDRLGFSVVDSSAPAWRDFHPWFGIHVPMDQPWHEQRTSERTIEIDGLGFDAGDDLIVHLVLDRPDDPFTPQWEGSSETYVLLFDLHTLDADDNPVGLLTTDQREGLFAEELGSAADLVSPDPRFTVPVLIPSGDALNPEQLLAEFAIGLSDFMAAKNLADFATPGFTLSRATTTTRNGREVLQSTLDFPAPIGGLKPSVSLRTRVLPDSTNTTAYEAARSGHEEQTSAALQERVSNYGPRHPRFRMAWIDPASDREAADRTISLVLTGPDPLAAIGSGGSRYQAGDLLVLLDHQVVGPHHYDVVVRDDGELSIVLKADQPQRFASGSVVQVSLRDGHGFIDSAGHPVQVVDRLAVDNWGAWQGYGVNPTTQLFLDPAASHVDDDTIRLSFLSAEQLSLDPSRAVVPELDDFRFQASRPGRDQPWELAVDPTAGLRLEGSDLIVSLVDPLASDVSVVVSYDPLISRDDGDDPFTSTAGVPVQPFQGQLVANRSPDREGPSLLRGVASANRLSLTFDDPSGVQVGDAPLGDDNLPYPGDVLIEAQRSDGSMRVLSVASIALSHTRPNQLDLQLEERVEPGDRLMLSYEGRDLQDGAGHVAVLRDIPIVNATVDYQSDNRESWFQSIDLTPVVFDEIPGSGGMYLQESGSLSTRPEDVQIQDDYLFSLDELSLLRVDLTDQGGSSLDDPGDFNLDFSLQDLTTQRLIGGSWSALDHAWLAQPSNDERQVALALPAGDYRLSVHHAELQRQGEQPYQLELTHAPTSLKATQLDTTADELTVATTAPMEQGVGRQTVFVELLDSGRFTATAPGGSDDLLLELHDLRGSWLTTTSAAPLQRDLLPGLYRLEISGMDPAMSGEGLSLTLDSSWPMVLDGDSRELPSGSIAVDGLPVSGELNPLDTDDFWTINVTGGEIYSLRASGFQTDVNLIVEDAEGHWLAQSWNWGELLEDGSFRPSDETLVLDLRGDAFTPGVATQLTVRPQFWGDSSSSYSLRLISHATLEEAQAEAARGVLKDASLIADAQLDQLQLQQLTALQTVHSDTLEQLRAEWNRQGLDPSGSVLAAATTLHPLSDPQPLMISTALPESLPEELRAELRRSDPAVLREQQSQWQFNVNQVAELMVQTADQVVDLVPISKPLGVKVASPQPVLTEGAALLSSSNRLMAADADLPALEQQDLGLQRIVMPLDETSRRALLDNAERYRSLVWYKTPAQGDAWIFSYDDATGTGARLEDTDPNQDGPDVMAIYVRDGGRGDDDGLVNGSILVPGGLAFAQLVGAVPKPFAPLMDGLALARNWSGIDSAADPVINPAATELDLDGSGGMEPVDLALALRHGFGTFPGAALTEDLSLQADISLEQIQAQLLQLRTVESI